MKPTSGFAFLRFDYLVAAGGYMGEVSTDVFPALDFARGTGEKPCRDVDTDVVIVSDHTGVGQRGRGAIRGSASLELRTTRATDVDAGTGGKPYRVLTPVTPV